MELLLFSTKDAIIFVRANLIRYPMKQNIGEVCIFNIPER
jgi:hypothetical protein